MRQERSAPWACLPLLLLLPAAAAAENVRLGADVVPTFEAIHLRLDAGEADYRGAVRFELEVAAPAADFRFHSVDQELEKLVLNGPGGEIEASWKVEEGDVVRVTPAAPLAPGSYTLEIDFTSPFGTKAVGLYRMEHDGAGYAFTQFEADDAREAFPCWDEPGFKIPFQLTLTVPEAHLAITNTPVEKETVENGWRTIVFGRTKPLPTYLLALATGPLEAVPMRGLDVPGRIVTVKGQSHLADLAIEYTPPILEALEEYFGTEYPYAKLDQIAIPEYWMGAMEHPGAVTYADRILLVDAGQASVGQRRSLARIIAHELAHMWFGNLVTMQWWDDLWLNESFADWLGDKITAQLFPQFDHDVSMAQASQGVMRGDARSTAEAIRRPVESTENLMDGVGVAYNKGKTVLGMFEQWLGPEVFRRGVLDYLAANAWGSAVADDLWRALDKASGSKVSAAMATFFEQPGLARIDVSVTDDGRVELRQERFRNLGSESADFSWQVPVTLKYPTDGGTATKTVLLGAEPQTVSLGTAGKPAWVFPNATAWGYYRWTLPEDQLRALAENAVEVLTPRERVAFIGNASALLFADVLNGDDFLYVLRQLADDPEPLVVSSVIRELGGVEMAFVPAELEEPFAHYVRQTLGPALERFGLEKMADEAEAVSLMRPGLLGWLGEEGRDERVREYARSTAAAYMKDSSSVDPSIAGIALRLAAREGDRELFDAYRKRFEEARVPADRGRYLGALGAFQQPEIRAEALRYSLEGPLRPNELFTIPGGMSETPADRDYIFAWVTENYEHVTSRLPAEFAAFMPFVASGCSLERLEAGKAFFSKPENSVPGTQKRVKRVAEQVGDCVALRAREGEAVGRFLRGLGE